MGIKDHYILQIKKAEILEETPENLKHLNQGNEPVLLIKYDEGPKIFQVGKDLNKITELLIIIFKKKRENLLCRILQDRELYSSMFISIFPVTTLEVPTAIFQNTGTTSTWTRGPSSEQ